ncbi:zinc finger protein 34-like [Atheta coriaria]|uniref:zinc finger protein 34-like n=1 Tax=Dalotia coriaria TaxID=877792 RepID=UPI0031F38678
MEPPLKLHDSLVCRLCAEENNNGSLIYHSTEGGDQLSDVINKYLPLKVSDDGRLPCTLCPGCTIQLEATKSFFDLIIEGQRKLQTLFNGQQDHQGKSQLEESGKEQLESALKLVNPNSSVQTYSVQSDESGEKIFIQILSDGPLFPPDHELSMKLNNEKPKKKRGRPPKPPAPEVSEPDKVQPIQEEFKTELEEPEPAEISDGLGKRRRRIKKPLKYSDLIEGKELDRVFLEEGINDEEHDIAMLLNTDTKLLKSEVDCEESKISETDGVKQSLSPKLKKVISGKKTFECEICGRCFMNQSRMEMHKVFHKDIFYQCIKCSQSFDTKEGFMVHSEEMQHEDFKLIEYVDNYGQIELPTSVEKDVTTIKVAEPLDTAEKLKCELCDKLFSTKQNLDVHHKAVHNNTKPYACDKCDKQFPYFSSYKNHLLQHVSKTHACDQCEKVFSHPSSLVYHRETEHNNGRKFVCNKCKKSFKHKQLLLRHQLVHTSERPFSCTECKGAFKTRANLINHIATHTKEKKFFCTECGLCFPYKTSLNLHQRWHNGQKDYECDVCMKTFSQKGNMVEHRRIHTGEKPFCCSYCGRRFTTSSQYKLHVKRHTGERPWRCEYCSKTFLHKDTWRSHERLHTGEKPYTCDICGKSFADSSNLKKHTKTHYKDQNAGNVLKKNAEQSSLNDNSQVLYLTYDDPSENPQPLVQGVKGINDSAISAEDDNPDNMFNEDLIQGTSTEEISIDVQQLVDNDGNVISITTDDGQQIKVVTTMDDEQCIQGLMPDGTLIPINLSTQDGKPVAELIANNHMENSSLIQPDLNSMELLPPEESNDSDKDKIQFLNEDGQNLCFIAYGLESNSMGENQFININ